MFPDPERSSARWLLAEDIPLLAPHDGPTRIKKWLQLCVKHTGITQARLCQVSPDGLIHWMANSPSDFIPLQFADEVSQKVIQTGDAFLFSDHDELVSGGLFPLMRSGQVIGLLGLLSNQTDYFKPGITTWIRVLAETLSNELAGCDQGNGIHEAEDQLNTALLSCLDVRDALPTVLEALGRLLEADVVTALGHHQSTQRFELIATHGLESSTLAKLNLYFETGLAGKNVDASQAVWIEDLQASHPGSPPVNRLDQEGFRGYLVLPLMAYNDLAGVIEVFWRKPRPVNTWNMEFLEKAAGQIAFAFQRSCILRDLRQRNDELSTKYNAMIEGLSRALELRDLETEGHTRRVSQMMMRLVKHVQIPAEQWDSIRQGALLHDIGKLGIPDAILLKPGSLTARERKLMQQHVLHGYNILVSIISARHTLDITLYHHEQWDGKGYPYGLQAEQIPQAARLFAVVDVFDALTSDRPYRAAWPHLQALQYIKMQAGRQFDPHVVDCFLEIAGEINQL